MNYVKTARLRAEKRITQSIHGRTCLELAKFFRDYAAQYPGSKVSTPATSVFVVREEAESDADMEARHAAEEIKHFARLTAEAVERATLAERDRINVLVNRAIAEAGRVIVACNGGHVSAAGIQAHLDAEHRLKCLSMCIGAVS